MLIICSLLQRPSSNGRLAKLGLSFKYRCSRFSRCPISSGIDVRQFSPTLRNWRLLSEPIVLGSCTRWLEATIRRVSSRNAPISLGNDSSLFSSRSNVRSFLRLPISGGIFRSELLLRIRTSKFWSLLISSGSEISWFVPRFSSTILVHAPMSNGSDVNWLEFIFRVDKYLANEKILYGILSIWLCCMLIECTEVNCDGPPSGNEVNWFLASVMLLRLVKLDNSPSGSCETQLPSIVNSSMFSQWLSEIGICVRRLYLIPSRLRSFRLPIDSGNSHSSLCCTSRVVSCVQLPMVSGKYSRWLKPKSRVVRFTRQPIECGKIFILFSRRLSFCRWVRFLISFCTSRIRLNRR